MSTKPQRYSWTATGMRPSDTQHGVSCYMNEFDVARYVSDLEAKITRLTRQLELKEIARAGWKDKALEFEAKLKGKKK